MKKASALLLIIAIVVSLCACGSGSTSASAQNGIKSVSSLTPVEVGALTDDDGTAYFPNMKGDTLTITGDIQGGYITPDKAHIVYISKTGQIAWYNADLAEEHIITTDAVSIANMYNRGFFYLDSDDMLHRYIFENESDLICCEKAKARRFSDVEPSVIYTKEADVYILAANSEDSEKVSSFTDNISLDFISNDASCAIWSTRDGDTSTIYYYENGEKEKIGDIQTDSGTNYNYTFVMTNPKESYFLVYDLFGDTMYVKSPGADAIKVKLGESLASSLFYTPDCSVRESTEDIFNGMYVLISSKTGASLYWIDKDGDREKVVSDIESYFINKGAICYLNSDGELYTAKLKGAAVSDEQKVASDVSAITHQNKGGYVYYLKNYENKTATLYLYNMGDKEPVKVAANISVDVSYSSPKSGYIKNSTDGKTVYFFKDCESGFGDLYKFSVGDSEPTKISSEIMVNSLDSGIARGELNSSFIMKKYLSKNDSTTYVNWLYYDGKEITVMAKDVHSDSSVQVEAPVAPAAAAPASTKKT